MLKLIIHPNQPQEQVIELEAKTILIGSSDENDLILADPTVSSHHCRIEESEGRFQLVNLSGGHELKIDGENAPKKSPLSIGSLIEVGAVTILFKGRISEPTSELDRITTKEMPAEHALITTPGADKGYLPTDTFIQPITVAPEKASAGMLPLLSLILSILGPMLFGIGLILGAILESPPIFFYGTALFMLIIGIVFGFLSRAAIRRRGGFLRDQQVASWGLFLSFGWLIVLISVLGYYSYSNSANERVSKNEAHIKKILTDIAVTQAYIKHSLLLDRDNDFIGEYADLRQLLAVKYSHVPKNISANNTIYGYKIAFHNVGVDGFMATAIPEVYKNTGRESYYIDEEGFLRGEDIRGKDPASYKEKTSLAKLSQEKSIYELYAEELTGDIFRIVEEEMRLAEKEPENKVFHYRKAESMVTSIRKHFPLSSIATSLDAVDSLTKPVIIDYRATEEYHEAMTQLDKDKPLEALEILKAAESTYPTASNIIEIRAKIAEVQEKYLKELEAEAKLLYDDAKKKELEGNLEAALENYTKIRDKYDKTTYAKDIEPLIEAVQTNIKENKAEEYIAQLGKLTLDKDFDQIISIVELINRNYSTTQAYSKNAGNLADLNKKAGALALISQGIKNYEKQDYRVALQNFQKAIEEYPDAWAKISRYIDVYLWNGKYALDEKDYRKALDYFLTYRRLNPEMTKQQQDYLAGALSKAYFEVGKLDYQQGNIEPAQNKLFIAATAYAKDPEFNYIYGSVLLDRKQYLRAIEALSISAQYRIYQVKSLKKRGFARIEFAYILEDKLKDILIQDEEFQYLLDVEKIKASKKSEQPPKQDTRNEEQQKKENSKEEDKSNNNGDVKDFFFKGKTDAGSWHRTAKWDTNDGGNEKIHAQEAKQTEPALQQDYPLLRILELIEEIEKGKDTIAKEEAESQGDRQKKEQLSLKKTRMVEEFQAKYATIKVGLDKSLKSKEDILNGMRIISDYFLKGIEDINAASQLSMRNREVEDLIAALKLKIGLYNSSYVNLLSALQSDTDLGKKTLYYLNQSLDQFKGWGKRVDISRNLKYAFLMSPSKEAIAKGLSELVRAFDVTVNAAIILRSGGVEEK